MTLITINLLPPYNCSRLTIFKPIKTSCLNYWLVLDHDRDIVDFGIAKPPEREVIFQTISSTRAKSVAIYLEIQRHSAAFGHFFNFFGDAFLRSSFDVDVFHFSCAVMARNSFTESIGAVRTRSVDENGMEEYSITFFHRQFHNRMAIVSFYAVVSFVDSILQSTTCYSQLMR